MSNWYIGQQIVAVKSCSYFNYGDIFIIRDIKPKPCKCHGLCFDINTFNQHKGGLHGCCKCNCEAWVDNKVFSYHYEHWFAPLGDISELEELLKENTVTQ